MNKPIKFELAKLLKEKGFDKPCSHYYRGGHLLSFLHLQSNAVKESKFKDRIKWLAKFPLGTSIYHEAPTLTDVIMWLYETYGIWIGVGLTDNTRAFYFQPTIWTSKDREYHDEDMIDQAKSICNYKDWKFNSPTEAYEKAIEYTLNNLI